MRQAQTLDPLAHSLTDLMISLMVIFILLMIAFVSNQHPATPPQAASAARELRQTLTQAGFAPSDLAIGDADPHVVTIRLPEEVRFKPNDWKLSPEADQMLGKEIPRLAAVLCGDRFRDQVKSFTIDGYADQARFRGLSVEEGRIRNLVLSQQRSREVAQRSLGFLASKMDTFDCVADRIEASGHGSNGGSGVEASRRVLVRVRLDPAAAAALQKTKALTPPGVTKMLRLFDTLRNARPHTVHFELSEQEVNDYLQYALAAQPRFGVRRCTLKFGEQNQIVARVEVSEEALDRLPGIGRFVTDRLLGGRNFEAAVQLHISDGTMTYSLLKAQMGGLHLPERLVREGIRFVGERQPERYDFDAPIPLPFGLSHLETHTGRVIGDK